MRPGVLITGGAKRIGAGMAHYFVARGYDIALHYNHSADEARQLQSELIKTGAACHIFKYDMADVSGMHHFMAALLDALPNCNALINNASVFERMEFLETDEALFDRQMDINFKAPFFLSQAFARRVGKGGIINMIDSDVTKNGISHFAYMLSKKTLADFTLLAARALGPGIRVNAVCPGCILPSGQNDASYEEKLRQLIPLQSHASVDEVAETAYWLLQQQHITGQLIYIDGGKHVI